MENLTDTTDNQEIIDIAEQINQYNELSIKTQQECID
jgi:hypothetical protein